MTGSGKAAAMQSGGRGRARSVARLAATQALYQILLTGAAAENVVREFESFRAAGTGDASCLGGADLALFADIVRGAAARREEIEAALTRALTEDWPIARLETPLRAILWAAGYELIGRADIPLEVVINEYVDVAHAFFSGKEPSFVNGVLDRLAHDVRGRPEAAQRDESTGTR